MIVGATYGQQQMGEGRRPQSMSARSSILGVPEMPPQFKTTAGLGPPPNFDHNKNSLAHKEGVIPHPHSHVSLSSSHPQPFTASWLTEVARMAPLRGPDRLPFPTGGGTPSVADYYQHYQGLPLRSPFYPPPFLAPPPYLRDSPHCRHPLRNFASMDSRVSELTRSAARISPPLVHPLGPPSLPPPSSLDLRDRLQHDPRDPRGEFAGAGKSRTPQEFRLSPQLGLSLATSQIKTSESLLEGEPGAKKRHLHSPFLIPSSSKSPPPIPSNFFTPSWTSTDSTSAEDSDTHQPLTSQTDPLLIQREEEPKDPQSDTHTGIAQPPFHSHFQRGSLVTVGQTLRRVEDLQTSDFVEAAKATDGLLLDPSTVGAILSDAEKSTATITFIFPSTQKEIPVEASNDHPFFVFHRGWSSCNPEGTLLKYDLKVRQLKVGDVCVSLRKKSQPSPEHKDEEEPTITDMPPPKNPPKSCRSNTPSPVACTSVPAVVVSTADSGPDFPSTSLAPEMHSSPSSSPPPLSKPVKSSSSDDNQSLMLSSKKTLFESLSKLDSQNNDKGNDDQESSSHDRVTNLSRRPASRMSERRTSKEESSESGKSSKNRKRRWSDPEH